MSICLPAKIFHVWCTYGWCSYSVDVPESSLPLRKLYMQAFIAKISSVKCKLMSSLIIIFSNIRSQVNHITVCLNILFRVIRNKFKKI